MAQRGLVSASWLAGMLAKSPANLRVLDATFHMLSWNRNAYQEFQSERIPTAGFFDLDAVAKQGTDLPHMLPSPEQFDQAMHDLGVGANTHVVVYDCSDFGIFSAPRLWWTLRAFGHDNVSVLNGGMQQWKTGQFPLETGTVQEPPQPDAAFKSNFRPELVRSLEDMIANRDQPSVQVADARSTGRFNGTAPEPRAELSSGHIPNSTSLPFTELLDNDAKVLLAPEALTQVFQAHDLDLSKPLIATCGSGVTASVIAFAAQQASGADVAVYDGSWTEYASQPDAVIATSE
eukprot:m.34346 g.34346  ORF g.34346 m.34346 type:complete len:290 (-) comp12292_c0_seq2:79-948(-)